MAGSPVTGDIYVRIDGRLHEIKSQLRNKSGYPFELSTLERSLQRIVEGRFGPRFVTDTGRVIEYERVKDYNPERHVVSHLSHDPLNKDVVVAEYDGFFEEHLLFGRGACGGDALACDLKQWETREAVTRDTICAEFDTDRVFGPIVEFSHFVKLLVQDSPLPGFGLTYACLCTGKESRTHLLLAEPYAKGVWRLASVPYIKPGVCFLEAIYK